MKFKLACASVLVLSGCAANRDALDALQQMQILENSPDAQVSYKKLTGWGNDLTLNDVEVRFPPSTVKVELPEGADRSSIESTLKAFGGEIVDEPSQRPAGERLPFLRAETMTLKGLTLKDGKPLARDIVLNKVTPVTEPDDDIRMTIDKFGIEGMNEVTGAFIAGAFAKDGPGAPPAFEQWAFDKAALSGLSFSTTIPQEESRSGAINVQLGEVSVTGLKDTYMASARIAGLKGDVDVPMMPAVTGTFDFGTLDIGDIHGRMISNVFLAAFEAELDPTKKIDYADLYKDMTSPLDGGFDRVDWTGMKVNISGLKLDSPGTHAFITRDADGVAVASHTDRTSLRFQADSSGGTLGAMGFMVMAMAGYDSDTVELYTQGDFSFDPKTDLTRWKDFEVGVTDAFDIKVSGGIKGLRQAYPSLMAGLAMLEKMGDSNDSDDDEADEDSDEDSDDADADDGDDVDADEDADHDDEADDDAGDDDTGDDDGDWHGDDSSDDDWGDDEDDHGGSGFDEAAMLPLIMGLLPLQLTDLDISITDQKVIGLVLDSQAAKAGLTGEQLRTDLAAMVSGGASALTDAGVDPAIANELTTAISGFLSAPGTLHITLNPKTPFGAMTAMMQPITKESLGFSASFTPLTPVTPASN